MNFLKDILNSFKTSNSVTKLGIISDIITTIAFLGGIILSPRILFFIYHANSDTYFGTVLATTFSIITILIFLIFMSFLISLKNQLWTNSPIWLKLVYIMAHVAFWGFGAAFIPGLILFYYGMVVH